MLLFIFLYDPKNKPGNPGLSYFENALYFIFLFNIIAIHSTFIYKSPLYK